MTTERKDGVLLIVSEGLKDDPICAYVYETEDCLEKPLRCGQPHSAHGIGMRIKHGFVRASKVCAHTPNGKLCGIQQRHWIHDPQYGGTHMFMPEQTQPRNTCLTEGKE